MQILLKQINVTKSFLILELYIYLNLKIKAL